MYGFQSYISVPTILSDGSFSGTLCAIDPRPTGLSNPETISMFKLLAELIATHPDAIDEVVSARHAWLINKKIRSYENNSSQCLGMISAIRWRQFPPA
jgi:hypothetical protein